MTALLALPPPEDDFEAHLNELERQVRAALVRAYAHAASRIDIDALADAIATQDELAIARALNLDEGLQTDLNHSLGVELIPLLIGAMAFSMQRFADRYGSRFELASHAHQLRTEIRRNIIEPLARKSYETLLMTVKTLGGTASPREAADTARSLITLSPDQARSAIQFQRALNQAINHSSATNVDGVITLRGRIASDIRRRYSLGLNAAQRSMLTKVLSEGMTEDGNAALAARHERALGSYRIRVIAQQQAARALHAGEYLAFKQGVANRSLPKEARRFWVTMQDERVRHSHRSVPAMNRQGVGVNEPFQTPLGPTLYPPLEVNCRCRVIVRWPGIGSVEE